jgi:hypothetical protein
MAFLRHFALKVETNMSLADWDKVRVATPNEPWESWKITQRRAEFLAQLKPRSYECCLNSCICYVGPNSDLDKCPYCNERRYFADGRPRRHFNYISPIPRLVTAYQNLSMVEKLKYRHNFTPDPNTIQDVMDGQHYHDLRKEFVTVDGQKCQYKFFNNETDVMLGLSTDGFAPFRRRKKTCWPLLLFNYNLPPDIRFHLDHILCIGVIPGPHKPKDFDSFIWPLVQDLLTLAKGVPAWSPNAPDPFLLRAYLTLVFGDIPAISMVMRIKGHNGYSPCRMCKITGLRPPGSTAPVHYVPLDRSRHPKVRADPSAVKKFDPLNLPLRSHNEFIAQAHEVQFARNEARHKELATQYGIKGESILSSLSSLSFPGCFPYDFMHLVFENEVKNLVLLFTGAFKELDQGTGEYHLLPGVWDAIGEVTAKSGDTIPGAFGCRPPNPASDRTATTAESWSFWLLYLGPILLARKFVRRVYYDHFVDFVLLIHKCMQFEMPRSDVDVIRDGFAKWVKKYEE